MTRETGTGVFSRGQITSLRARAPASSAISARNRWMDCEKFKIQRRELVQSESAPERRHQTLWESWLPRAPAANKPSNCQEQKKKKFPATKLSYLRKEVYLFWELFEAVRTRDEALDRDVEPVVDEEV